MLRLHCEGPDLRAALIAGGLLREGPPPPSDGTTRFRNDEGLPIRLMRPSAEDLQRVASAKTPPKEDE
jgi:hypothetical protein